MLNKFATMLLALMLLATAAQAESSAQDTARALVPDGAALVETDRDDGLVTYEFRDGGVRYDIVLDAAGNALARKAEQTKVRAAAQNSGEEAAVVQMAKAALAGVSPACEAVLAFAERDDGRWVWKVFLRDEKDLFELELNAETGEVKEYEQYFGAAAQALLPDAVWNLLKAERGDGSLVAMDLEYDDGRLVYSGTAAVKGVRYEFEALAQEGTLLEWERD